MIGITGDPKILIVEGLNLSSCSVSSVRVSCVSSFRDGGGDSSNTSSYGMIRRAAWRKNNPIAYSLILPHLFFLSSAG